MKVLWMLAAIAGLSLQAACKVEPQEINYGKDACHFCKMSIVDKTHAAEVVTSKGKAFKYDAIECLLNDLSNHGDQEIALHLVSNYKEAGSLIDAKTATYIISENIRSPMGENLSALADRSAAETLQKEKKGTLFSWKEIVLRFDKQSK